MPLRCCRVIAAYYRCASGVRAALPELVLIYEPLPITTQARHYATRGSITTAALPNGCGLSVLLVHFLTLQKRKSPTGLTAGLAFFLSTIEPMATISDLHEIYAFQFGFAIITSKFVAFCCERDRVTEISAPLSSRLRPLRIASQ